jgi:uncharacterized protein YndB with AHSA1/START domain
MPTKAKTARKTQHATFVIERIYDAAPARIFAAFSDIDAKSRWFGCSEDWVTDEASLDFREGGREIWRVGPPGGVQHVNSTLYFDIVPNERFVLAYEMYLDKTRISVSLLTIEFKPEGDKRTKLVLTEQDAFLDGYEDNGSREAGTRIGLDSLAAALAQS